MVGSPEVTPRPMCGEKQNCAATGFGDSHYYFLGCHKRLPELGVRLIANVWRYGSPDHA